MLNAYIKKYKLNKFRKWTHCILSIQKEIIFTDDVVFLGFFS